MNSITIAGQLGRDAELRYLPNGDPVASFSVADSEGQNKPTIWWRCSMFGKRAESLAKYLTKGHAVTVVGKITEREYEKDGATMKAMDVRVQDVALQGGRRESAPEQRSNSPLVEQAEPRRQAARSAPAPSGFDDMDDDMPF
jgi:single-strand DNA-binding protein